MYSGLRYLSHPAMSDRSHHSKVSGGFPHSDIHGSKPIPGSPWLNAGYHVLHRLLLPRHPPNALFALDLIQKEQGTDCAGSQNQSLSGCDRLERSRIKSSTYPHHRAVSHGDVCWLVYLTWNNIASRGRTPGRPILGTARQY